MKKIISFLLTGAIFLFFTSSCTHQPIQLDPDLDTSIDEEGLIILFSVIAISAVTLTILLSRKKPIALTPAGENVKLIMHEEAPEDAEYIGDIQSKAFDDLISVKNDLRNKAAQMRGNLLVIDTIQPSFFQGKSWGYYGSGRVYYLYRNMNI